MSGHVAGKPAHVTIPTRCGPDTQTNYWDNEGVSQNGGSQSGSNGGRSQSEPPSHYLSSRPFLTRRYSDLPHTTRVMAMPSHQLSLTEIGEEQGEDNESLPPIEALPSPAATEVHDPESQDIMEQIQQKGIKIRDFAYAPPYAPPYLSSDAPEAIPIASSSTALPPKRTTEVFDPYKGLIELDYRWAQKDRLHAVTGKTLRRLLDIGWLTNDDLSIRGHPMDVASLRAHDIQRAAAKEDNGGVEAFPWRPLVAQDTLPTLEERRLMLDNCGGLWKLQDRMRVSKQAGDEWRRKEEEEAAQKKREFEEREEEREKKRRGKRKMVEGADIGYRKEEPEDQANSSCGPKRIRLSPSDDDGEVLSSQDTHMRPLLPPKKQYPAPLQAYNPKLYPDAATIIQASSQSRPSFPEQSTPPAVRADTPPLLDDGRNTHDGQRLIHRRKHRGLGRTQTFTDFF